MTDMDRGAPGTGQQGQTDGMRQRAIDAYDSARDSAYSAGRRASGAIEEAPLVALGAGIAAGAIIAALLPTTRRERDLLKPYGSRMTGAARDAADAARKVGSQKLQELGLMPDTLLDKAGETVRSSAQAAVGKLREDARSGQSSSESATTGGAGKARTGQRSGTTGTRTTRGR